MKKILSFVLCFVLLVSVCTWSVSAQTISQRNDSTIEYFEDGSYVITEWDDSVPATRTSTSKTKKATYYLSNNTAVFAVSLTGYFNYTYGVSAEATSQSVSVSIYLDDATFVSKSSTHSGATVYGSGTVSYADRNKTLSVQITCDKYGGLT